MAATGHPGPTFTLNPATGQLAGTPTTPGTFSFTIRGRQRRQPRSHQPSAHDHRRGCSPQRLLARGLRRRHLRLRRRHLPRLHRRHAARQARRRHGPHAHRERLLARRLRRRIFTFGQATFRGSTHGTPIAKPIVAMAATASGNGYWLVSSGGGIFAFPDAPFHRSTGVILLDNPIVGMAKIR